MARIETNVPLSRMTTLRIGGLADQVVYPESQEEIAWSLGAQEPSFIIGAGSNLLVSDSGIRGTVLSLKCASFANVRIIREERREVLVEAQSGVLFTKLAILMMRMSLSGIEFGYGIPGLFGGALKMNAGAYDGQIKDVVESVTVVSADGTMKVLGRDEIGFEYRSSMFPIGCVITGALLRLRHGDKNMIHEKMRKIYKKRKSAQPLDLPSAGSVFKNPADDYAGRLIEKAGLKGARVGSAMISERHANFIVNKGDAKACDVVALMERMETQVLNIFGVKLEREIELVGEF